MVVGESQWNVMNKVTKRYNLEGNNKNTAVKALQNSCKSPAVEITS